MNNKSLRLPKYQFLMLTPGELIPGDLIVRVSFDDIHILGEATSSGREISSIGVHYRNLMTGEIEKLEFQMATTKVFALRTEQEYPDGDHSENL